MRIKMLFNLYFQGLIYPFFNKIDVNCGGILLKLAYVYSQKTMAKYNITKNVRQILPSVSQTVVHCFYRSFTAYRLETIDQAFTMILYAAKKVDQFNKHHNIDHETVFRSYDARQVYLNNIPSCIIDYFRVTNRSCLTSAMKDFVNNCLREQMVLVPGEAKN